jgi:hypothetical protein
MDKEWKGPACGELEDKYTSSIFAEYFAAYPEMAQPKIEVSL